MSLMGPKTTTRGTGIGATTDGHDAGRDLRLEVMHLPGFSSAGSLVIRCFLRSFGPSQG